MAEHADEELMQRYAAGDYTAFELLFERHGGGVYRYLYRSTSSAAVAEDLYQDVWTRVIEARRRYQPSARFTTWLYRIAHNRLVDHYRRQRPQEDDAMLQADAAGEPLAQGLLGERAVALAEAIARLPEEQRSAVLLQHEQGLSLEQIAEVTGVGRETVKSRLRYAMRKLREALVEHAPRQAGH